jgi:predicted Zn finger-like uncharacterized protein
MDVRCEKCQTEYELDEARLKPGGVTVKCTNCGHMFKIRKRSNTAAGTAIPAADPARAKPPSKPASMQAAQPQQTAAGPGYTRSDSLLDDAPTISADGPTSVERQWLIRLENGEQKSCRELATLQQWIVAGVVSRESLISRSGKTWKRLGDITELMQYFEIADEARTTARKSSPSKPPVQSTMLGVGGATAAGGTILPDDDAPTMRKGAQPTPPPPVPRAPPARRPTTQPPPPPKKGSSQSGPLPEAPKPSAIPPAGNRATAAWANDQIKPSESADSSGPSGPRGGKLSVNPDEPAFAAGRPGGISGAAGRPGGASGAAGRVRAAPSSEHSFDTDRVRMPDDDDSVMPARRGSSAGLWILLVVLLLGGATTVALYFFVFRKADVKAPADAAVVAQTPDAAPVVTPVPDAPDKQLTPVELARNELAADNEARLKTAYDGFAGQDEPESLAIRAQLGAALAQAFIDRAGVVGKTEGDKLRKQAKAIVLEALTAANKAHKAAADDPSANIAFAHVLRLQNKPAKEVRRYLGQAKPIPEWAREAALGEALLLARDGKLDDAKTAFAAIDSGDGKLETSNDVRARFHLALIALAQNRAADAKPLVDQVLAAQPEHLAAKALSAKLETLVAKTDPLPPEDPTIKTPAGSGSGSAAVGSGSAVAVGAGSATKPPDPPEPTGNDYDSLVKRANALAESNCTKANELFTKALEIKPNGVDALTGQGYCALDAKNFATAHRKFSTALATSRRYEPALAGIAETYTTQGLKAEAIAAWRRYLEAYPGTAKATKALDRLGAGSGTTPTPTPGSGAGSDTPPTPPPTPPTPPPTPPEGTGSGSG